MRKWEVGSGKLEKLKVRSWEVGKLRKEERSAWGIAVKENIEYE
jgi:hypothetical protein